MNSILIETAIAGTTTSIVATSVNAEPLVTALIGFGTALVTVVGGELIKFLVAYFKKKTDSLEEKKPQDKDTPIDSK